MKLTANRYKCSRFSYPKVENNEPLLSYLSVGAKKKQSKGVLCPYLPAATLDMFDKCQVKTEISLWFRHDAGFVLSALPSCNLVERSRFADTTRKSVRKSTYGP